ncbi:MAG: folate family ECF transporter S component [Candidatus Ancillula sp.]|nr:folate family ECF transporter S component [Candidatus Ancillula sp.]
METETEMLDKEVDLTPSPADVPTDASSTSSDRNFTSNPYYFEIACAVILLAASIIFGRVFAIKIPILSVSLGFVPLMIAGVVLKPYTTVLVFVLSDIIGALLFPHGAFFIGFTFVALFNGLSCGLLLGWHNLKSKEFKLDTKYLIRIVVASFLIVLVGDLFLNTWMISITQGKSWAILFPPRVIKELVFFALHIAVLIPIAKVYESLRTSHD